MLPNIRLIVCFYLTFTRLVNSFNNVSLEAIIHPDPTEIDPIWEATIRNVVFNTTQFKPSNVTVIIEKANDDPDNDETEEEEVESFQQDSRLNDSLMVESDAASSQNEYLDDSIKVEREKALRTWIEASLVDISKKSKILKADENVRPLTRWSRLSELFTTEVSSLAKAITPTITESLYSADVSSACSRDFLRLVFGVQNNQDWAWRILDANGRLPSGIISGNSFAFGDYDQCLDHDDNMASRYCLLHFTIPVPKARSRMHFKHSPDALYYLMEQNQETGFNPSMRRYLKLFFQAMYSTSILNGICVPATCSAEDVQNFIISIDSYKNQSTVSAGDVRISHCTKVHNLQESSSDKNWFQFLLDSFSVNEKMAFASLMILFVVPLFGWTLQQFVPISTDFLDSFSPLKNIESLFTINQFQKASKTQFLSIIRIVCTFWILLTHCAILGSFFAPPIVYRFEAEARSFAFSAVGQLFYNAFSSVEIFFFLSGFLLLRNLTKNPRSFPSFMNYVLYRYLRLIPAVIGLLSLFTFWPFLGTGPVFERYSSSLIKSCEKNWWKTVLFVSNYDKTDDVCLTHTWFLSADFQLHLISYPILLSLQKGRTNFARFMIFVMVTFELFWTISKLNERNTPPSLNALLEVIPEDFYLDMQNIYYPTQNHFISYFMGLCTAYYLQTKQNITSVSSPNILLLVPGISFATIFFPLYWTRENGPIDVQSRIGLIYSIFSRFIHPFSIACICLWALPKTVKFHSRFVTIVSRLSFSIYLVHLPLIWHFLFTTRQPFRIEIVSVLFFAGGILLFTIPLSICFYIFIEAPYTNVCNRILLSASEKTQNLQHNMENNNKIIVLPVKQSDSTRL